jgi:hypothetical protein
MHEVRIASIKIGSRHRKDLGDLRALARSIREEGLLQPVGITEDGEFVFGARRLLAIRDYLKQKTVLARVVRVSSIAAGEFAENEDFTAASERVAIARNGWGSAAATRQFVKKLTNWRAGRTRPWRGKRASATARPTGRPKRWWPTARRSWSWRWTRGGSASPPPRSWPTPTPTSRRPSSRRNFGDFSPKLVGPVSLTVADLLLDGPGLRQV